MGPYNSRGGSSRGRGGFHGGRQSGPRLPSALLAEVDVGGSGGNRNRGRPRGAATRQQPQGTRREEVRESLQRYNNAQKPRAVAPEQQVPKTTETKKRRPQVEMADEELPKKKKKKELTLPGKKSGDAEDGEIEWLEYMLRKEKGKKDDELTDDGLDELLGFADVIGPGGQGLEVDNDDDEDIDLSSVDDTDDGSEGESREVDDVSGDSEEESTDGPDSDEEGSHQDERDTDDDGGRGQALGRQQRDQVTTAVPPSISAIPAETPADLVTATQASSTSSTRYIPPHLRAAQLEARSRGDKEKEQERIKLERKAQGLLNKLSEANMETILGEIEGLYRDNSRNDVSTILTDLVIQTIADRSNLLDSFVILYATLVGALHRIIGLEFGAHFVHTLIAKYRALSSAMDMSADTPLPATLYETPDASKSPLNLLTLIAELYNAQIVGANLIYDLIRSFLTEAAPDGAVMAEGQVESLLRLLRCSGQQLRSDDPASLKDIVNLVQDKTKGKEKTMTTRARYMIETLVNLKGGKSKSNQNTDQDAAMRMKKFLNSLGRKRRVATTEPLRVSLQDLLNADSRGKWWLVGAGWSGNPLVEREQALEKVPKKAAQPAVEDEEVLLEAARRQGMNTDVRRSIFVILMTSEDFIHACDRLSHLKFTEVQQREFVRVALHCCTTEKTYNPYHTLILNKLCAESYSHRFTFQYALWDFLRESGEESGKSARVRCANVAKVAAYVVARSSLDLTVFKAVDFTLLKSSGIYFFSIFLTRLILATQTPSPLFTLPKAYKVQDIDKEAIEETFEKALSNLQLAQGLMWIIGRKGALEKGVEGLGEVARSVVARGTRTASNVLGRAV